MDISSIKSKTKWYSLVHPATFGSDEPKLIGWELEIVDFNHDQVTDTSLAHGIEINAETNGGKSGSVSVETKKRHRSESTASHIVGWRFVKDSDGKFGTIGGKKPDYSPELAVEYAGEFPWIRPQILTELGKPADFFTKVVTSS